MFLLHFVIYLDLLYVFNSSNNTASSFSLKSLELGAKVEWDDAELTVTITVQ